jgi:eukaryotic-like serine/threonine-protein kinase
MNERALFLAALEIEDPAARKRHLQSACGNDARLLARVEALLGSHEGQSQFLNVPVVIQLAEDAVENSAVTQLFGSTTTNDGLGAGASSMIGPESMTGNDDPDDAIPLHFLESSSRPDSLGRLAHYEILEVLGQGAFGIVFKALDEKLQRVVAIKVLSPQLAATSPARKRFLREARASAAVRHENVVSIYDVEDEPIPYLVMEYIPGETLQGRLDNHGPLDLPDVLRLGKQIADGLAAAHAQQLIHRDVKPGNILLDTSIDDHVKITDFGLARTADDASMTQSGMIAGTPLYMAPEQAFGHKLDHRADLFSFGSVLYHMLSGRPPFRASSTVAVLKRVTEDTPRPIQEIIPEAPDWMCEIIGRLLAKNPDERYGSAKAVSKLLATCLADVEQGRIPGISVPRPEEAEEPAEPAERVSVAEKGKPRAARHAARWPRLRVAVLVLIVLFAGLGITEATGVSQLATTVIRLTTGSGTLVIEADDPGIQVTVSGDGDEVTIRGGGVEQLTLRPGKYQVAASIDGKPVKQELVTITRNGRSAVRIGLEAPERTAMGSPVAELLKDHENASHPWPADAPPLPVAPFDAEQAKQHQQAWADYLGAPVEIGNSIGMKLRLIPPGQFLMRPNYNVTITKPLQIGSCEVTIAQFRAFVDDDGYKTTAEVLGNGQQISDRTRFLARDTNQRAEFTWRYENVNRGDDYPVAQLSWEDAVKFCEWLSRKEGKRYRLPTEAEWEWACRAGSMKRFHFGDEVGEMDNYAWYVDNSQSQAHPVGLKKPNSWGLFDVHGNVCEYCSDWHATEFPRGQVSDPGGPPDGRARVTRGGGYISTPQSLAFGFRGRFMPTWSLNHFGFRIVCDVDVSGPPADGVETADPDRRAAEWALSAGGIVQVDARPDWIKDAADLPKGPFRLTLIHFYYNEKVTDSGLAHFEHCKNLSHIKLHGQSVSDAGMVYFKDCKDLTSLVLVFTKVSDVGLANFQDCRRIEVLILPGSRVTDAGLAGFKDCQNLKSLDLGDTAVGDLGLAVFADRKSLEKLNLSRSQVSDAGLRHFQGCTELKELLLIGAQVTDAGLSHFQDSVDLEILQAPQTHVSDRSIPLLATMTRLARLNVRETMITADGVEALRQALPQCEIEWDGGVIEPVAAAPPPAEADPP